MRRERRLSCKNIFISDSSHSLALYHARRNAVRSWKRLYFPGCWRLFGARPPVVARQRHGLDEEDVEMWKRLFHMDRVHP